METYVDPEHFCGTVYAANGWQKLGAPDGWGRTRRDYYVKHDRPQRLFGRERVRRAPGVHRHRQYSAPSQSTFSRLLQRVDAAQVNEALQHQPNPQTRFMNWPWHSAVLTKL